MKHLVSIHDMSLEEVIKIFDIAKRLKVYTKENVQHNILRGKILGMIFSKPSTRTRVSFEAGMYQLGGTSLFLNSSDIQLGRGESIYDTSMVLSRYINCIMIRTYKHNDVEELAKYGSIPIINGLTDLMHPCQALTDLFTVYEHKGKLEGLKFAYVGDGNNVANSLLHLCAKIGVNITVASPSGYKCNENVIHEAQHDAKKTGAEVVVTGDPIEAIHNADIVCTDTWVSMGEEEKKEERIKKVFTLPS